MDFVPEVAPIPGSRISGYRNSSPRLISAARQLGQHGRRIVRGVETRGFPNVEVATTTRPLGWEDIAKERRGERTNMIIIVCGEGDERLFSPAQGKPDMYLSWL